MHIKGQIDINATPDQVWPFLVDPVLQASWNPKILSIQSIDRPMDGPVTVGETYTMVVAMSGKESTSRVHVIEVDRPLRLVFLHHFDEQDEKIVVTETFSVQPRRRGTRVKHTIDLSQTGISKPFLILISLVTRLGKSIGGPYLDRLKKMIEAEVG